MKISYKPLWRILLERNMMRKDLMVAAYLTSNHIANMGKGKHIFFDTTSLMIHKLNE